MAGSAWDTCRLLNQSLGQTSAELSMAKHSYYASIGVEVRGGALSAPHDTPRTEKGAGPQGKVRVLIREGGETEARV